MRTEKQVVLAHLAKGDLEKMSADELVELLRKVKEEYPHARISGTAVVRRNGRIING